ncbi:MAG: hypothetical protein JXA99_01245, partial [Candidatus Lokiarchaeota archaeon]|nr:hypothetical protein [Candidatus Lokiarchaeota archaeon]
MKNCLNSKKKKKRFSTKLIFFAPKELSSNSIKKINKIKHIHDKTEPHKSINKHEPVCSILTKSNNFTKSYQKAMKIVKKINNIIIF